MSLATKLKIIEQEKGKKNIEILREVGVGELTVRKVLNMDEIRQAVKIYCDSNFDNRSRTAKQNIVLIHMERYLAQYIHRKEKEGGPVNGRQINKSSEALLSSVSGEMLNSHNSSGWP